MTECQRWHRPRMSMVQPRIAFPYGKVHSLRHSRWNITAYSDLFQLKFKKTNIKTAALLCYYSTSSRSISAVNLYIYISILQRPKQIVNERNEQICIFVGASLQVVSKTYLYGIQSGHWRSFIQHNSVDRMIGAHVNRFKIVMLIVQFFFSTRAVFLLSYSNYCVSAKLLFDKTNSFFALSYLYTLYGKLSSFVWLIIIFLPFVDGVWYVRHSRVVTSLIFFLFCFLRERSFYWWRYLFFTSSWIYSMRSNYE